MQELRKKKNILWISPYAPYDSVTHAGGQDINHSIKYLHSTKNFNIHVASLCLKNDLPYIDLDGYNIPNTLYSINNSKIKYHLGLMVDNLSKYNFFHSNGNLLTPYLLYCFKKLLKQVSKKNLSPNIIILHWTQSALLSPIICKLYPHATIVIVEVDIAYQGYKRQYLKSQTLFHKFLWKKRYFNLKKKELSIIKDANVCVVLNKKDADILINNGISKNKIFISIPFYHNYSYIKRNCNSVNIIYFGYMGREENHLSALWFIQNVMPILDEEIHFIVIGTEPKDELSKLQTDRIHILGYVEDISPYFAEGLCMVAPLVLGAGIKIKILEGMSAGIPVLTNSIGIEGIPARDKHDFFYCNTPSDYVDAINKLKSKSLNSIISLNAQKFINNNFNTDNSLNELISLLLKL